MFLVTNIVHILKGHMIWCRIELNEILPRKPLILKNGNETPLQPTMNSEFSEMKSFSLSDEENGLLDNAFEYLCSSCDTTKALVLYYGIKYRSAQL